MDLEVRHLRVVHAIAGHGSISKAASSLGLSQPSLAGQLQRIERMLGGRLFERVPEGSRPTPLGEWIIERSSSMLHAFDTLQRDARHYVERGAGNPVIRVGCADTALAGHVSTCMYDLFPEGNFTIRTEECLDTLPALLEAGRLELAVLADYPGHELVSSPDVVYEASTVEPLFVGLAASHPLAGREEIDLADLAEESWAMQPNAEIGYREHFWAVCHRYGFTPRLSFSVNGPLARDLIKAGKCVGLFLPTSREQPGIVIRPLAGSPLLMRNVLGWTPYGLPAGTVVSLVSAVMRTYWSEAAKVPRYAEWLERRISAEDPFACAVGGP
ncbi:LysR family transcriptional regulator [Planomonospora sp. ID67723]|uniref:LysR family transcriptional regulator n=1 Tax=Planomonospora sp. ID67723 TaxID=2738134 RepID=UPI0018C42D7A|nr:LysR family transcriptional regulator [Planomonospora sp. ID67723]MBG0827398.1 LysR family transcriptional regulator [Planomonospora sp. ID67723]